MSGAAPPAKLRCRAVRDGELCRSTRDKQKSSVAQARASFLFLIKEHRRRATTQRRLADIYPRHATELGEASRCLSDAARAESLSMSI